MLAMALMMAEVLSTQPTRMVTTQPAGNSIEFPDQIAPAIIPYLVCIQSRFGEAQKSMERRQKAVGLTPAQTKEANDAAVQGCTRARTDARTQGIVLAKAINGSTYESRIRIVEEALASVEGMNNLIFLGQPTYYDPPKISPLPAGQAKPGMLHEGGVVVPNAISDHFERYTRCLIDHTAGPGRVMPYDRELRAEKTEAAIETCTSVKQAELVQAKAVLRKSTEFKTPAEADAAAEATFAAAEAQQRQMPEILEKIRRESVKRSNQ